MKRIKNEYYPIYLKIRTNDRSKFDYSESYYNINTSVLNFSILINFKMHYWNIVIMK